MIFGLAALFVLLQAAHGGVVPAPAVVSAPARFVAAPFAAPFVASAPAPLIAAGPAPFVAPAPAPLIAAAPAPLAAYAKAVPQTVAPFATGVNFVARAPFLPYTAVGNPFVETFSAPYVARRFAAAPLVAAHGPYVGTVV